jgi:hypothetical protein
MIRFLILIFLLVPQLSWGQSSLPPCPETGAKQNCFGSYTFGWRDRYTGEWSNDRPNGLGTHQWPDGQRYVGEFNGGRREGLGVLYRKDQSVEAAGKWLDGQLIMSIPSSVLHFPFDGPTEAFRAAKGKTDSERLVAEVEVERKKRQELEERLAAESKEREGLLVEVKERERQQAQTPQTQRQEAISRLERRVALLVGNGAYKQSPLDNAVNDATDLNAALKTLGFQTILLQNSSLQMMKQKTREFADLAINADVALIFYSGHGIEYRGNNYLIPTSTGSLREFEVEDETFNVSRWMDMLETQNGSNKQRVNIVILDACRDNAFSRGWRNTNRGLARMDAPSGTILAYSTSPGKVASDGNRGDRNSPYTKSLLRAIQQQNTPIEQVFKDVRRMVVEQTKGEQIPWENSSLIGNFVFRR